MKKNRIGTTNRNTFGSLMTVVVYNKAADIWVQFNKGNPVHTNWTNFLQGKVKNPYDKTIYGVGYIGEGEYSSKINGVITKQYDVWNSMLTRCYSEKYHKKYPAYKDCTVSEEWHNFQTFAKWYDDNYYEVDNEQMHLDKDILVKRNKIYSPDACIFAPKRINKLFIRCNSPKRSKLPIGVILMKRCKKYTMQCNTLMGISKRMGGFDSPEDAFLAYKKVKEETIKQVAEEYKDKIPDKLYEALCSYSVEIND